MLKKALYLIMLSFAFFTIINSANCQDLSENDFVIKSVIPDESGNLLILEGNNQNAKLDYSTLFLDNPSRAVIDIKNAVLVGSKASYNLNSRIKNAKIAQYLTKPNIVRIVLTADSKNDLSNIKINKSLNSFIFKLDNVQANVQENTSIFADKNNEEKNIVNINNDSTNITEIKLDNKREKTGTDIAVSKDNSEQSAQIINKINHNIVINSIKEVNDHISLAGIGKVSIREPFILKDPSRVVFDLPSSVLESKDLLDTIKLSNDDVARIGQFDAETVRIVIESKKPEQYKSIVSPDLQSVAIVRDDNINLSELPNSKTIAQVRDVYVKQNDNESTTITIISSEPVIHNIKRNSIPDRVKLELYNVNAPAVNMIRRIAQTQQLQNVGIDLIEKYPHGSKWTFFFNNAVNVESRLSIDGKVLELTFKNSSVMPVVNYPKSGKYRVVIDPGHGGYEVGAQRSGIYEKDINLDVAKRVQKYLAKQGISVIMTRTGDETLSLKQRTVVTNRIKPDVFVSIHANASADALITGLETHWYTNQSRKLAGVMQSNLIRTVKSPNRGTIRSMFYVIHHTDVPAVLVEMGFMSNSRELYDMLTEERKETTARAIAKGILEYLGL